MSRENREIFLRKLHGRSSSPFFSLLTLSLSKLWRFQRRERERKRASALLRLFVTVVYKVFAYVSLLFLFLIKIKKYETADGNREWAERLSRKWSDKLTASLFLPLPASVAVHRFLTKVEFCSDYRQRPLCYGATVLTEPTRGETLVLGFEG